MKRGRCAAGIGAFLGQGSGDRQQDYQTRAPRLWRIGHLSKTFLPRAAASYRRTACIEWCKEGKTKQPIH